MRQGRPSKTALDIARIVAYASMDPLLAPLLPPGAGERTVALLRACHPRFARDERRFAKAWMRRLLRWEERHLFPGFFSHVALRKRWIEEQVEGAIAAGARQVIVLGAGFDTLAVRLSERHAGLTCIELDHPATQAKKRRGLADVGAIGSRLYLCEADLTRMTLEEALRATRVFQAGVPSVFVAEGLLMYLAPSEVDDLFATLRRLAVPAAPAVPESRIVFTFLGLDARGRPCLWTRGWLLREMLRLKLALVGEPLRSGIDPDGLRAFLGERGFELVARSDEPALSRALAGRELAAIPPRRVFEFLATAAIGRRAR